MDWNRPYILILALPGGIKHLIHSLVVVVLFYVACDHLVITACVPLTQSGKQFYPLCVSRTPCVVSYPDPPTKKIEKGSGQKGRTSLSSVTVLCIPIRLQ